MSARHITASTPTCRRARFGASTASSLALPFMRGMGNLSWCASATSCRRIMWALGFLKPRPTCMVATSPRKATASQPTSMPQDYSRTTTIPTSLPVAIREKPRERCTTTTTVRTLRRKTFTRASTASTSSSTRWTPATRPTLIRRLSDCPAVILISAWTLPTRDSLPMASCSSIPSISRAFWATSSQ